MSLTMHMGILAGIFMAVLGFYFAVMMDRLRITYTRLYGITSLYFFVASGLVISLYRLHFKLLLGEVPIIPPIILTASIIIALLLIYWARTHLRRPTKFIEKNSHQSFILLDYRYFLSKGFEIIFQQTIVVLLVILLAQAGFSLITTMFFFAAVFGLAHIPLIFYNQTLWGWYYTVFSFIAGFIFPPLILRVDFGFVYSFLIHWLFYALGGILFWLYNQSHE